MRETNNITDADLRAMEQLDKNCLDLHLFPPPKTFIQMEVEGPDGKIESRKMRSQSWHRNAYNMIMSMVTGLEWGPGSVYGPGTLAMKNLDGTLYYGANLYFPTAGGGIGGAGTANRGIVVGASAAAENFNNYSLAARIINGNAIGFATGSVDGAFVYSSVLSVNETKTKMVQLTSAYSPYMRHFDIDAFGVIKMFSPTFLSGAPTDTVQQAAWSPDENYLATWQSTSLKILKYDKVNNTLSQVFSGSYGQKNNGYNDPQISWCPDNSCVAIGGDTPRIIKNNGGDSFTAVSVVGVASYYAKWSPDGEFIAYTHEAAPWVSLYKKNADLSLTQISIATTPTARLAAPAWTPDSKRLFFGQLAAPWYYAIEKTGDSSFAKVEIPMSGATISAAITGCYSSDGKYFCYANGSYINLGLFAVNSDGSFSYIGSQMLSGMSSAGASAPQQFPNNGFISHGGTQDPMRIGFVSGQLAYSAQNPTIVAYDAGNKKFTAVLSRVFNNNSPVNVSVNEVGWVNGNSTSSVYFMFSRDVLAEPLVVPPAYKLTVTYTMEMTFPA